MKLPGIIARALIRSQFTLMEPRYQVVALVRNAEDRARVEEFFHDELQDTVWFKAAAKSKVDREILDKREDWLLMARRQLLGTSNGS